MNRIEANVAQAVELAGSAQGPWLSRWKPLYTFLNVLRNYVDLDCFLVPLQQQSWLALHRSATSRTSTELAYWIATPEQRWQSSQSQFSKLKRGAKSLVARQGAFCDLYVPVVEEGKVVAAVVVGPFADHLLTEAELRQAWLGVAGRKDVATGDDFHHFCRTLLDAPILDGPAMAAFQSLTELFAASLTLAGDDDGINAAMDRIFVSDVCGAFYHETWCDHVLRQHPYYQSSWHEGSVTGWERREFGISGVPQRVLACAPAMETLASPQAVRIRARRFQREALRFVALRADATAGRLSDYGVVLLHAPLPGRTSGESDAMDLALDFQSFMRRGTDMDLFCGIGPREPKEQLRRSYLGALESLQRGVDKRRPICRYEGPAADTPGFSALAAAERSLIEAVLAAQRERTEAARTRFTSLAQTISGDRPDALRTHFQRFGQALVEEAARRSRMDEATAFELGARWAQRQERAGNLPEMAQTLRAQLDEAALVLESPPAGARDLRFSKARAWVEENFQRDPSVQDVAAAHGFSASTFARELKRATGFSYSQWLTRLRLDYVEGLLENTPLSAAAVAASAGFDSPSYFFQWFKRNKGMTPGEWRAQRRKKAASLR